MLKVGRIVVYSIVKAFPFVMGLHSYFDREILPPFWG